MVSEIYHDGFATITVGNNNRKERVYASPDSSPREVFSFVGFDLSHGAVHLDGTWIRSDKLDDRDFFEADNRYFLLQVFKMGNVDPWSGKDADGEQVWPALKDTIFNGTDDFLGYYDDEENTTQTDENCAEVHSVKELIEFLRNFPEDTEVRTRTCDFDEIYYGCEAAYVEEVSSYDHKLEKYIRLCGI